MSDVEECFGVQLDPSGGRGEPGGYTVAAGRRVLPVAGLERQADTRGGGAELFERDAARRELVLPAGVDVSVEELLAESEPGGEVEDDLDVRAGLTHGRHQRGAQLHQGLRLLRDLEADLQSLGLEGTGHRQHDVGLLGRRAHEEVEVDLEVECLQCVSAAGAVAVGHQQVRPEAHQPRVAGRDGLQARRCRSLRR